MASKVENNKIFLTRGDSFETTITMAYAGSSSAYTPQPGDVITFALKEARMTPGNQDFVNKTPLISKTIPNETLLLSIEPADTKNLKFGNYKYDVEIVFENGKVCTFIDDEDFFITPEVH